MIPAVTRVMKQLEAKIQKNRKLAKFFAVFEQEISNFKMRPKHESKSVYQDPSAAWSFSWLRRSPSQLRRHREDQRAVAIADVPFGALRIRR
ncbi:MAG: hypothetical protein WEB53_00385 [Akkermansiaceae bacterium]